MKQHYDSPGNKCKVFLGMIVFAGKKKKRLHWDYVNKGEEGRAQSEIVILGDWECIIDKAVSIVGLERVLG